MVEWDKYGRMYTNTLTNFRFDHLKHHLRPKILWFDRLTHTFAHFSLGSTLHFQKRLFFENQLILIKFFKSWKNLMILIRFWFGFDLEQVYQRELCILSMKTSSNQSIYHQFSFINENRKFLIKIGSKSAVKLSNCGCLIYNGSDTTLYALRIVKSTKTLIKQVWFRCGIPESITKW